MIHRWFVLLLPLFALGIPTDSLDAVPEIEKCGSHCSGLHEVACKKGCKFAYALTFAPSDYPHNPTCADACNGDYSEDGDRAACHAGCTHFQTDVKHVQLNAEPISPMFDNLFNKQTEDLDGGIRNLFPRIFSSQDGESFFDRIHAKIMNAIHRMPAMFSGSSLEPSNRAESNPDASVIKTRVRIFFFTKPDEEYDNSVNAAEVSDKGSEANQLDFSQLRKDHDDEKTIILKKHATTSGICNRFFNRVHEVFGHPINLGLTMIVSALMLLLIMQIILYVHRRSRRSHGHEYTRLPTYTEAVQIKLPVNDADLFKPLEKSKPLNVDADA